jgi:hypothetical protein
MAHSSHTILGRLADSVAGWLEHRRDIAELARLTPDEFASIANDLRLSPVELTRLAEKGTGTTANLDRMLDALEIERSTIVQTEPAVMHDMERVCAFCSNTARCRSEIAAGTAGCTYREFCANSGTLDALATERRDSLALRRRRHLTDLTIR